MGIKIKILIKGIRVPLILKQINLNLQDRMKMMIIKESKRHMNFLWTPMQQNIKVINLKKLKTSMIIKIQKMINSQMIKNKKILNRKNRNNKMNRNSSDTKHHKFLK